MHPLLTPGGGFMNHSIQQLHWEPSYEQQQVVVLSLPRRTLMALILEFRDNLAS
jgi:hypothetical protein